MGLVSLPYGGTYADQRRVDPYVEQLCAWRTDAEGHSIEHLTRDMLMATLFVESEAFALANRGEAQTEARPQPGPVMGAQPDGRLRLGAAG